jgi:hypothetical protein
MKTTHRGLDNPRLPVNWFRSAPPVPPGPACSAGPACLLMSSAFANVDAVKRRLVSVGRYALRGISHPQELFTLDPEA